MDIEACFFAHPISSYRRNSSQDFAILSSESTLLLLEVGTVNRTNPSATLTILLVHVVAKGLKFVFKIQIHPRYAAYLFAFSFIRGVTPVTMRIRQALFVSSTKTLSLLAALVVMPHEWFVI
jgi:hypothetical protein